MKKLKTCAELYEPRGVLPDTGLKKPKPKKKNKKLKEFERICAPVKSFAQG